MTNQGGRILFQRIFHLGLALAVVLALGLANDAARAGEAEKAKPYVVMVHADWCGTCTLLEPTWQRIEAELGDQAVVMVFDVTDKDGVEQSRADAERLGLVAFFDQYRSSTGTIGVLDGETGEPVRILKGERDFSKYEAAVIEATAAEGS